MTTLSQVSTKLCTHCDLIKPLDDFHRQHRNSDKRLSWCKACTNANAKERYERNKLNFALNPISEKRCSICYKVKKVAHFHLDKRNRDGYSRRCLECLNSRAIPAVQQCSLCGETKPSDAFYRRTLSATGIMRKCKECHNAQSNAAFRRRLERKLDAPLTSEQELASFFPLSDEQVNHQVLLVKCQKCKAEKPQSSFAINGGWSTWCVTCLNPGGVDPERKCMDCEKVKPLADFHIIKSTGDYGYTCLECVRLFNVLEARYAEPTREHTALPLVDQKRCGVCEVVKPAREFWSNPNAADNLQYRCISCGREAFQRSRTEAATAEECLEFHIYSEDGYTQREIAHILGFTQNVVSHHLNNKCGHDW